MLIFQNFNSSTFKFNNIKYVKNFMVIKQGNTHISVHNAFDTRQLLVNNVNYTEISVNGTVYNSQTDLINALAPILFSKIGVDETALELKEPLITIGTNSQYFRGDKTFQTLDKTAVGLSNVDNTSDVSKPISTATQTALNSKINGAGTINYIPKFISTGAIGNSLIFDNGTNIGIGSSLNSPSAILNIASTTKGILIPRMSTTQRLAIVNPEVGLQVYDLTENKLYYFDDTIWVVVGGSNGTGTGGGITSTATGNYLTKSTGSTSVGNSLFYENNSKIGLNNTNPQKLLDVNGDILVNGSTVGRGNNNLEDNLAFGAGVLGSVISGLYNVGVGSGTIGNLTNGSFNTAMGYRTLVSLTTGNHNVAVGVNALAYASTASANMGLGTNALFNIVTGFNNVGVGYNSGRFLNSGAAFNDATNSLYLGSETTASFNGVDGEIVIGNGALGMGYNSVSIGNTAIDKTVLRGTVLIGSTIKDTVNTSKLQVAGYVLGTGFKTPNGLATQFLMADGTVTTVAPSGGGTTSFGTTAGTSAEGNDTRIVNGQTAFSWGNHAGLYASANHSHNFATITNKPTTLAGYGITDGGGGISSGTLVSDTYNFEGYYN